MFPIQASGWTTEQRIAWLKSQIKAFLTLKPEEIKIIKKRMEKQNNEGC